MAMPIPNPVTAIDELLALPDDGMRHELLDGEHVVTPAPSYPHQIVLMRLYDAVAATARDAAVQVLVSPGDITLNARTLVQPDLVIVLDDGGNLVRPWTDVGVPLLAAEVLSPSTAARDHGIKRRLYLEAGVEEYWIVDTDARLIERWLHGDERPEINDGTMPWRLSIGIEGEVSIPDLFDRIER